jgi:hypothetical protein
LSRVFGSGPEQFSLQDATGFFGWSDADRRFVRVGGPAPAAFPDTAAQAAASGSGLPTTRSSHPAVTSLGATVVAVGYNPITAKYWRKQHDAAGTHEPTFKIYEPADH